MGSAHRLTEANIRPKFNENLSKGSGDMERTRKCYRMTDGQTDTRTNEGHFYNPPSASRRGTRNSRLKSVTLNCDLEFVSAWSSYEFCKSSH